MTTQELAESIEAHIRELQDEEEHCKAALAALTGRKRGGRPRLTVAA